MNIKPLTAFDVVLDFVFSVFKKGLKAGVLLTCLVFGMLMSIVILAIAVAT